MWWGPLIGIVIKIGQVIIPEFVKAIGDGRLDKNELKSFLDLIPEIIMGNQETKHAENQKTSISITVSDEDMARFMSILEKIFGKAQTTPENPKSEHVK